ncbi:MAG: Hsp20/alpha crystallin family protein [Gammaproteobacteria bacterium]|nr:Hsp20/alpha crystallin family protein [Gammaproteobacteria bacterium]
MSIVKWDPFRDIEAGFSRMFPMMLGRWPKWFSDVEGVETIEWSPSADISETETEYLIRADLPAVKKEDVKITVESGMLTIEGERKDRKETKGEKFHRIESFHGAFARRFALPDNVDEKGIRAECKDGILTVHLPKTAPTKAKAVEIKVQ